MRHTQDIPLELEETLRKLAVSCRVLAMEGHNDMSLGHLSFRDPQGRGLWLKKAQRGLEEIFDPSDFLLIDFEGRRLENEGFCHSEWPIHTEIMLARPDVNVVGHTHAYYSVLFSAAEQELEPLNHEGASLRGRLARFGQTTGLINTRELGRALAQSLGDASVVLMKNHGITFVGAKPEEATLNGIYIERACGAPRKQVTRSRCGIFQQVPAIPSCFCTARSATTASGKVRSRPSVVHRARSLSASAGFIPARRFPPRNSAERHVAELGAFIGSFGVPVYLVGHSRGGRIALHVAANRNRAVRLAVLIEPGGEMDRNFLLNPPQAQAKPSAGTDIRERAMQLIDPVGTARGWHAPLYSTVVMARGDGIVCHRRSKGYSYQALRPSPEWCGTAVVLWPRNRLARFHVQRS